ncbi:cation:proton antiporter [Streptomyces atratus]|uniref:cation:proton antiporter n=1 Tax=Streptomyces atratus TaxID=1893 RepID=UPI002AC36CEE|nr:cation:proton antiporter [Streptomyces atratus]WPW33097.1 cation:proton antiporter [Streptomyces atratus]
MSGDLLTRLLVGAAVMMVLCRVLAALAVRVGQPPVVAEMVAGIALGPSLFGLVLPDAQAWVFPADSTPVLYALGQLGIAFYMFLVGLEFSGSLVRGSGLARRFVSVSFAGMAAPFVLGIAATYAVFRAQPSAVPEKGLIEGALYAGVVASVTALPMLARIIEEEGLLGSRAGTVALGAAAVDDVVAWVGIGLMLALTGAGHADPLLTVAGFAVFVALLFTVVRRALRTFLATSLGRGGQGFLPLVCALLFAACAATEFLGLHVVIGAFVLGLAFPKSEALSRWEASVRPFAVGVLLPFYFVYTGLRTQIQALDAGPLLLGVGVLLAASVIGKLGACTVAARLQDPGWLPALRVGVLMNTRGLVQLIALNIGLEAGLLTQTLFTQLVIVAVLSTVLTAPGLALTARLERRRRPADAPPTGERAAPISALPEDRTGRPARP